MAEEDAAKEKVSLLPEFFVDLICRITPGIVFIPIWAAIIVKVYGDISIDTKLESADKYYALIFLIFIAFAYIVGFIADIIADYCEPFFIEFSQWLYKVNKHQDKVLLLQNDNLQSLMKDLKGVGYSISEFNKIAELISITVNLEKSGCTSLPAILEQIKDKIPIESKRFISEKKDLTNQQKKFLSKIFKLIDDIKLRNRSELFAYMVDLNIENKEILLIMLSEFEYKEFKKTKCFMKTGDIISGIDRLNKPQQELLLKKMLAEATLFKSLFVLYLVTIFPLFSIIKQDCITNLLWIICFLLGIFLFLMFTIERNIKVQERLNNFKWIES